MPPRRAARPTPESTTAASPATASSAQSASRANPGKSPTRPPRRPSGGGGSTAPWTGNLRGPAGQLFGEPLPSPDETAFQIDNTSAAYYNSPYYTQHQND